MIDRCAALHGVWKTSHFVIVYIFAEYSPIFKTFLQAHFLNSWQ